MKENSKSPERPTGGSQDASGGDENFQKGLSPSEMFLRSGKVKETVKDLKQRMRREVHHRSGKMQLCKDEYEKATQCAQLVRKSTGLLFDQKMTLHKCEWDPNYPACPERYTTVMNRLKELNLIERCQLLNFKPATDGQVVLKHPREFFELLRSISQIKNLDKMEEEASKYDAIYFNEHTFEAATLAVGGAISLVENICTGVVQNGLAVIRPPGHHAMESEFCGYCYFNNVAIATQYALNNFLAKRVLIVDFDVHHGQGTQQMFYEDNRVLYFSIHRYEHGSFWPSLRESNFDYIGMGNGQGYNINVPLNKTGLGDDEYMSIVLNILLPVAYEFNPDLVIVSAGYDSALGDEKGMMKVTPGFYNHLITLLSGLANGRIAVCLEGGYFLPSLAEGVAMTLKSLLDDPPAVLPPLGKPDECVIEVINNLKCVLRPHWKCFINMDSFNPSEPGLHKVEVLYKGEPQRPPYETRNCYPTQSDADIFRFTEAINELKKDYECLLPKKIAYSYHPDMLLHSNDKEHPEKPERLKAVHDKFIELSLNYRCCFVPVQDVDVSVIEKVHDGNYLASVLSKVESGIDDETDVYRNEETPISVMKSVSCLISVVESVWKGEFKAGAALIRPPGHHAERNKAMGFCFVNNVAAAAKHMVDTHGLRRVLILDFDVHHGNGTQHAFYDSKNVLYMSIHRYDNGNYYPKNSDANYCHVGAGEGLGFNVNVPFNTGKMTDVEYLSVFHRVVLPIAYAYAPEIIIVSAGFDAGVNDTLGNYMVTPEAFGQFVQLLKPLAGGKIVLALEGGYNVTTVAHSMNICIKTLLGDPLPLLTDPQRPILEQAEATIKAVINTQKHYWPTLEVNKKLPKRFSTSLIRDNEENGAGVFQ